MTVDDPSLTAEVVRLEREAVRAQDLAGFAQGVLRAVAQAPLGGAEVEQLQQRLDALTGPRFDVLALRSSECRRFVVERLADVQMVARGLGYALALHGSVARDVDLVAVPWVAEAVPPDELVAGLMETIGRCDFCTINEPSAKPHRRLSWAIWMHEYDTYIDLSVMPLAPAVRS